MSKNAYTPLVRVDYQNLESFLEQVNRNFAIIQNSPLFKGIPGNTPEPGERGEPGKRGSNIIFVDFHKFIRTYGTELSSESNLNLKWFNDNLLTTDFRKKLCQALDVTELSNNDIIILGDTSIYQYKELDNQFINTGKSLNMYKDVLTNVNKQVEEQIRKQFGQLTAESNNSGSTGSLYTKYPLFGINYENGSSTVDLLLDETLLFPGNINQSNQVVKTELDKLYHSFAGIKDSSLTHVFGDINDFNTKLHQTLTVGNGTNSIRTINKNSIPVVVLQQKTNDSGLLLGSPNARNIRDYAGIHIEQEPDSNISTFVIQSNRFDTKEPALKQFWSELRMNNALLSFNKNLKIEGDSELKGNTHLGQEVSGRFIRSGIFTRQTTLNQKNRVEIGFEQDGAIDFIDKLIRFKNFVNGVLSTDESGNLSVVGIEKSDVTSISKVDNLTWTPTSDNNVVLVKQLKKVVEQFNSLQTAAKSFLTSNQLQSGVQDIRANSTFIFGNNERIKFDTNKASFNYPVHINGELHFAGQGNKVLVTDSNGKIIYDYSIEQQPDTIGSEIFEHVNNKKRLITSYHLNWIVEQLSGQVSNVSGSVYTRADFANNRVKNLGGEKLTLVNGAVIETPHLTQNSTTTVIKTPTTELTGDLKLTKHNPNRVLTTNGNKVVETTNTILGDVQIPSTYELSTTQSPNDAFLTGMHYRYIVAEFKKYGNVLKQSFWTKEQLADTKYPVDKLYAKDVKASNVFSAGSDTLTVSNLTGTKITSTGSQKLEIEGHVKFKSSTTGARILTIDNDGNLHITGGNEYYLEEDLPVVTKGSNTVTASHDDLLQTSSKKVSDENVSGLRRKNPNKLTLVTGRVLDWIYGRLDDIHERFKQTFNKQETIDYAYKHVPVGSIIMWTYESAQAAGLIKDGVPFLPYGWAPCDGKQYIVNGKTFKTPDMRNCFVAMVTETRQGQSSSSGPTQTELSLYESLRTFNTFHWKRDAKEGASNWYSSGLKLTQNHLPKVELNITTSDNISKNQTSQLNNPLDSSWSNYNFHTEFSNYTANYSWNTVLTFENGIANEGNFIPNSTGMSNWNFVRESLLKNLDYISFQVANPYFAGREIRGDVAKLIKSAASSEYNSASQAVKSNTTIKDNMYRLNKNYLTTHLQNGKHAGPMYIQYATHHNSNHTVYNMGHSTALIPAKNFIKFLLEKEFANRFEQVHNHTLKVSFGSEAASQNSLPVPQYYKVIYIMKLDMRGGTSIPANQLFVDNSTLEPDSDYKMNI